MEPSLSLYFNQPELLNSLSIERIDQYITKYPYCDIFKILKQKYVHSSQKNAHEGFISSIIGKLNRLCTIFSIKRIPVDTQKSVKPIAEANQTSVINAEIEHLLPEENLSTLSQRHEDALNANKLTLKIEENEISLTNSTKMQKKDLANDVRKKNKKKKRKKLFTKELTGLSPYALWLSSFKQKDIDHQLEKEHKKIEKAHLMKNIQKSIEKKQEIISESLAQILENQGHWDDAKKMYEALLYKYPEKSSYFASKISNLYTK